MYIRTAVVEYEIISEEVNMAKFDPSRITHVQNADPSDVSTLDGLMKALYESISFVSGNQPDFTRFRTLFRPQALIVPPKPEKASSAEVIDVEIYIKNSVEKIVLSGMERKGNVFNEIARRTLSFGNIVHIFSTFESKTKREDATPIERGVYSIQIIRASHRWWIVSLMWEVERPDLPLPRAYLI